MDDQLLLILCVAGSVGFVGFYGLKLAMGNGNGKLRQRLSNTGFDATPGGNVQTSGTSLRSLFERLGSAAAQPFMPKTHEKQSGMRQSLAEAGIYAPSAIRYVTGFKMIFLLVGLIAGYITGSIMDKLLLFCALGGIIGYLVPLFWLKSRIKANQKALTYGLPDALDLMVVCVEAGLTVDSAMQRVGQEMSLAHPALSRELGMMHMETRVGLARSEALKNLGTRTRNEALQSLAAMLIQAERFGTSIASALRIHADTLRNNRQRAAEESAAKASVKMSFPLVLFIFPATFIVLVGPTVINLMNSELMK